jgi:hypothetical protein
MPMMENYQYLCIGVYMSQVVWAWFFKHDVAVSSRGLHRNTAQSS